MAADERRNHILVINGVPVLLEVFRDLLEGEGYRVSLDNFSEFDLAKRLADVKRLKPDAVILDFVFSGEPIGWQLPQLLKLDRATEWIPVVVCTAAAAQVKDLEGHLRMLRVASDPKPFDIDALLAAVAQACASGLAAAGSSPALPE